ncbi:MAG: PKD domain-containing protein, partial [Ilumatobacteraceae bacterium]
MSPRRSIAATLTVALVALGITAVAPSAPASAAGETAQLPTDNPANFTPNVLNGEVDSIWQVGNTVIIGGTFTQVANATQNGGQVYNRTYLAAFNATTGVVDPNFAPVLSAAVTTVIPAGDGTSIYVAGNFNTVNGVNRRKVARINLSNGSLVTTFNAQGPNGVIKDLRLVGSTLYVGGSFTTINNQARGGLASLNATTGALTTKLNLALAGQHNGGTTGAYKFDVTPTGDKMVVIGNFLTIAGQDRRQMAVIDLATDPATVSGWQTSFYTTTCSNSFESYMRDVDIAEDGTYAVVTTTGAYKANGPCDTDARLEITGTSAGVNPTWVNYTGGDTSYAVEIHNGVAYIGGHMRWANNPNAGDQAGQGAVPRSGMMALDVNTGLPFSWNPGRERGVGLFDYHITDAGVWAGSDTDRWNDEMRQRLAFFPWSGGSLVPANTIGSLPNNVFQLGRTAGTTGTDPSVLFRVNAGGPTLASVDDGPDWSSDSGTTSTYRNSGSSVSSYTLTAGTTDATVPRADFDRPNADIFKTERYDPSTGSEMQWNFNVTAGIPVQVRLYMANKSTSTDEVGQRVFDVDLDGVNVINDLDLTQSIGHNIGTMKSFNITSDGQINILFRHGVNNPLINAIEIVRTDVSPNGTLGQQDEVQYRNYDGVNAPSAVTVAAGTAPWRTVRGAFMVNDTLFTLHNDGSIVRRTFNGTTFGAGTAMQNYANGIMAEIPNLGGIFFDPATSRIYYTLTNSSSLYYRSFLPESGVISSTRYTASGSVASLNPARVRGMFLAAGQIWFADNTTGNLLKIGFAAGAPTGTVSVADNSTDWRGARAMFLVNADQPNVPPVASFTSNCTVNSCAFTSTSTDIDGTITGYAWNFGDGQNGSGATPTHAYAQGGTYNVTLTVTDSDGATASITNPVTVTDPPNVPPSASFTSSCTLLTCTFTSTSTDGDGSIASYAWDFGDGATATTGPAVSHTFGSANTYTVGLTVTDDDGAPASTSASVTVVDGTAAAAYRTSNARQSTNTTASVQIPAAVQAGDQLVLIVTANTASTLTTPSGWTLLGTRDDGSPDMRSWVFTRTAVAGTGGSTVSATLGATSKSSTIVLAYSNAQAPTVLASSVMGASSTALATPAVAVAQPGSMVVNYWSDKSSSNSGWTLPGSVTTRIGSVGSGSGRITAAAGDVVVAGSSWAGATANSTVAGTKGIGWSIVVPANGAPVPNTPPTAAFTSNCTNLSCTFTSTSTDGDGTIASYAWDFGDTTTSTEANPVHTYAAAGTYTVTLTVTDDDGAPSASPASAQVVVSEAPATNVAFRAQASANTTTTAASIGVPASVQVGDQLLLFVTANVATTAT